MPYLVTITFFVYEEEETENFLFKTIKNASDFIKSKYLEHYETNPFIREYFSEETPEPSEDSANILFSVERCMESLDLDGELVYKPYMHYSNDVNFSVVLAKIDYQD